LSDEARVVAALRLAELRAGFGEKLVARLDELAAALTRARAGDGIARAEARMLAHRLAGTAGSYGYAGAGRHATVIEQALDGDDAVGDAAWSGIFAALDAARISSGP